MPESYDSRCLDLANYFLNHYFLYQENSCKCFDCKTLAIVIQNAVEHHLIQAVEDASS